jgi:hypothetical protein
MVLPHLSPSQQHLMTEVPTGQQRSPHTEFQQGRCPRNRSLTPATWGRMGRTSVIFNSRRGLVKFREVVLCHLRTPMESLTTPATAILGQPRPERQNLGTLLPWPRSKNCPRSPLSIFDFSIALSGELVISESGSRRGSPE